jgi:hypothetical protein
VRLINPGAGEISDRLTILALKILHGDEQGKEVGHWEAERTTLLQKIHSRTLNAQWFDALLELGAVNAMLWHAEDDLREWRQGGPLYTGPQLEEIRVLAFRIQTLNDRRADLVSQINKEAGDGDAKEKG